MNFIKKQILLILYIGQIMYATDVAIINFTSSQISATIENDKQSVSAAVFASENQNLNNLNNRLATPTMISLNDQDISKITITRMATTMPQIIYYDHQITADKNEQPGGIANINMIKHGTIYVLQDHVAINNVAYPLRDLSSYLTRAGKLQASMTAQNLDQTQKQVNDLIASIKLVQESDMADQVATQISVIQRQVDILNQNILVMQSLQKNLNKVSDLKNQLTKATLEQTKFEVHNLQTNIAAITQTELPAALFEQLQAVKAAIADLQENITTLQHERDARNPEILIFKNIITTCYGDCKPQPA